MILKSLAVAKLGRKLFFGIDKIFFHWIGEIYNLLVTIARVSPLSQADIVDISNRIYRLLAIFMVFKVTFSLIMYVVNPDDFSDKSKGWGKLTSNIIISLSLLILTPYIFNMAYRLQAIILEDNSIAALIFGDEGETSFFNSAGEQMSYIAMTPFMSPDLSKFPQCSTLTDVKDKKIVINEKCFGLNNDDLTKASYAGSDTLYYQTDEGSGNDNFELITLQNYATGVKNKNVGMTFREDIVLATDADGNEFIMDYSYIFSTGVAALIILLLISFCLDIATRSMKLAFYQLVAPIPIISFVDPKSGKDGMFKKWYTACFSTYLGLFIRLLSIYFAVYIISRLQYLKLYDSIDQTFVTSKIAILFILIGALMFAKQFPKILENLGIKLDGGGKFTLNPLKKLDEEALGFKKGRQLTGRLGAAGLAGALAGGTNAMGQLFNKNNWKNKDGKLSAGSIIGNLGKTVGSSIGGAASATRRGVQGAIKGEKMTKNFSNSYSGAMQAKKARDDRQALGVKWYESAGYNIRKKMGLGTTDEQVKADVKAVEEGKFEGNDELKKGFAAELEKRYGSELGSSKYEKLSQSDYFNKSNKEIADHKKSLQAKSKSVGEVLDGKGRDTLTSKARGSNPELLRAYEEVKNRKLDFYTSKNNKNEIFDGLIADSDKKYKDALARHRNAKTDEEIRKANEEVTKTEEIRNKYMTMKSDYNSSAVSADEKEKILQDAARSQYEIDRSRVKKAYEDDINKTLAEDLKDSNKKIEIEDSITNMYNSILSTNNENLRKAFESALDSTGKGIFNGVEIDFSKVNESDISSLMEALDKKGKVSDNAISALSKINDEIDTMEEIESIRANQTTELQSNDTAKKAQDIASVANSGGKK